MKVADHAAVREDVPRHDSERLAHTIEQAEQVYRSLSQILTRFLGYQPGYAGYVVMDRSVGEAVVQQVPFTVLTPRSPAAQGLEALADRLLGSAAGTRAPAVPFWKRLARWRWKAA